jgi:phage shock protein C
MNFMMLLIIGVFALVLLVAFVVLVALLMRTGRRDAPARISEPVRVDEPMRSERVERISREIEKINGMQVAGRISAEEAADLKAALEGERREWTAQCVDFARQSGEACAQQAQKRLAKSPNAVLAGVCGGLAEWFGCDAALVRVVYVLLALFMAGFPGILLYIILWIAMPEPETVSETREPSAIAAASSSRRTSGGKGWLIVLLIVPLVVLLLFVLATAALFCVRVSPAGAGTNHQSMEEKQLRNGHGQPTTFTETEAKQPSTVPEVENKHYPRATGYCNTCCVSERVAAR